MQYDYEISILERDAEVIQDLKAAFDHDSFSVDLAISCEGKIGIRAVSRTAWNYNTGRPKNAYYVEGDDIKMGVLLGFLAEDDISKMVTEFLDDVVLDMVHVNVDPVRKKKIGKVLAELMYLLAVSNHVQRDVPEEFALRMSGIEYGCQKVNSLTNVTYQELMELNYGIDVLSSLVYTGDSLVSKIENLLPHELKMPLMCNGFIVFGESAGDQHFMGRDFTFPNADVFQDVASMIIYNPEPDSGGISYPLVSMTAPGMVGSVTALNNQGVGMGVNMVTSGNCSPHRPGFNSTLLVNYAVRHSNSAKTAKDTIVNAQRGVSWLYLIGDGTNDEGKHVEREGVVQEVVVSDMIRYNFWYKI
jgi:hypothetical protein